MSINQLPSELLKDSSGEKVETIKALEEVDVLGIYFSASWFSTCRNFNIDLAKKYKILKEAEKKVEIIFVSSDRLEDQFIEYFEEMPWLALPYTNKKEREALALM